MPFLVKGHRFPKNTLPHSPKLDRTPSQSPSKTLSLSFFGKT